MTSPAARPLSILIPVYNDWKPVGLLLGKLDEVLLRAGISGEVVLVDDGSTTPAEDWGKPAWRALSRVEVVELRQNLGHQRAICVGLVSLAEKRPEAAVLILDADGEDSPEDVPRLLEQFDAAQQRKIIFAARGRRAEGLVFRFFYELFRLVHRLLLGFGVRIGNFSVIPPPLLKKLVVVSELWNHYAAAVVKSRLPHETVAVARSKRLAGEPKMRFTGLVIHGLSAISVYGDVLGARLLIGSTVFILFALAALAAIVAARMASHVAFPGWVVYTASLLLILVLDALMISLMFTFLVLYNRSQSTFLPARDCPYYISSVRTLFSAHE